MHIWFRFDFGFDFGSVLLLLLLFFRGYWWVGDGGEIGKIATEIGIGIGIGIGTGTGTGVVEGCEC